MITVSNFQNLLLHLGFIKTAEKNYFKEFSATGAYLQVDFEKHLLIYPEDKGLVINERQTCNFRASENFVVFECICRLFDKGYKPQHIVLEPRWQLGHGASGGRADILIRNNDGKALLIIECKTWGSEYDSAWRDTLNGKGQLFSYAHQERSTQYLCLYASGLENNLLKYSSRIIAMRDNADILNRKVAESPLSYKDANSAKDLYEVWKRTYENDYATRGIFELDVQPYQIGKAKYTEDDLQIITEADIQPKYHEFATILRQHNVSGRENAFDKLVNLFLCKIVDEKHNSNDLQFYWRGIAFDTYFDLIDRLQRLYRDGMREFLKEDVTYVDNEAISDAFKFFKNDPDATREKILKYFRQQKYFTNNDFSFLDVHNEHLFYQNAEILLKISRMLQDIRLNGDQQNQFLGNMFEFFLDQGFKQTEGQFFTPFPVTRFITLSLPFENIFSDKKNPPKVIDYACGAGHFLTEMASQLRNLNRGQSVSHFYSQFFGIEKEYRLSKVAKVSAFMYDQDEINIIYADALSEHLEIQEGKFTLLVSNPPYSVKGFLETLPETERRHYSLIETVDSKSYSTNSSIEAFFIERAKQLIAPHGLAAIITPSSILTNTSSGIYTRTREILLEHFDIIALVELGGGTFGKTGTNTVTMFLRRKDDNPAPADHYRNRVNAWFDADLSKDTLFEDNKYFQAYCDHIGLNFSDYKTLLQFTPSEKLLNTELFKEYHRAFNKSAELKAILKQKLFHQKHETEQKSILLHHFVDYVKKIEREKVFYFVLAYKQNNPILIVRSPKETDDMKKFLGYEWSAAKGQEGIRYLNSSNSIEQIKTPLFDPQDSYNPGKINSLIRQNFLGQLTGIPEVLQQYSTVSHLIDVLDFSRAVFDKQISLNVNKSTLQIRSKWEYKCLGDQTISTIVSGQSPESAFYNELEQGLPFYQGKKDFGDIFLNKPQVWTTKITKESLKGDILISVRAPVGDVNINPYDKICIGRGLAAIRIVNSTLAYYVFEFIRQYSELFKGRQLTTFDSISTDELANIKIPIPPTDVQAQIVEGCKTIDSSVALILSEGFSLANVSQEIKRRKANIFAKLL